MKKKIRIGLIALGVILVGIQFIQINKENPITDDSNDIFQKFEVDGALMVKIKDACYDCHSNHSEWPWYTNVQPVGWWIKSHVNEARKKLNFSEFLTYTDKKAKHKLEENIELLEKGEMPLKSFTWTHPEARLTELERATMVEWFKKQFALYN